jgi:hypothetical protein
VSWPWSAIGTSLLPQVVVVYVPAQQRAFGPVACGGLAALHRGRELGSVGHGGEQACEACDDFVFRSQTGRVAGLARIHLSRPTNAFS